MTRQFTGIWPAVLTPVAADGSPNLQVLGDLVEVFASQKLGGLYLTGSTGQWPLFSVPERQAIAARAIQAAAGKIPVMVHVGAMSTADSITLAQHAAQLGADAVSAVGPTYFGHPPEALFEHYRKIATATDLPFFGYHLSTVNQIGAKPEDYTAKLLEIPHFAGMKITDRDLYPFGLIHASAGDRLQLFSGADEVLCQAVLSGSIGAIGTFYNVWGPACQRGREACAAGQIEVAKRFMLRFQQALSRVLTSGGQWAFLRSAMRLKYGVDVGMPRAPLGATDRPWADHDVEQVLALVDTAM